MSARWRALALLLGAVPAAANGPPFHGETAFVTGLNGAAIRSFATVARRSGGGDELTVVAVPVIVPYEAVENRLVLGVVVPFVSKELRTRGGKRRESGFGLGDVSLFGKVNLFQRDAPQETFRVAGELAVSFPTGEDDGEDALGRLPPGLQRGSGAVDPSAMIVATRLWRRYGINADLGYALRQESRGVDPGDALRFDVSGVYRVAPAVYDTYPDHQWNVMIELDGESSGRTRVDGGSASDSGGTTVLAAPGIQYMYGGVIVEASVELPLATSLHGRQLEPDWTASLGFRWLLF